MYDWPMDKMKRKSHSISVPDHVIIWKIVVYVCDNLTATDIATPLDTATEGQRIQHLRLTASQEQTMSSCFGKHMLWDSINYIATLLSM